MSIETRANLWGTSGRRLAAQDLTGSAAPAWGCARAGEEPAAGRGHTAAIWSLVRPLLEENSRLIDRVQGQQRELEALRARLRHLEAARARGDARSGRRHTTEGPWRLKMRGAGAAGNRRGGVTSAT